MIVVTYLLRQSITLYKNLGGGLEQNLGGGLEPLSPIASVATVSWSYSTAFYMNTDVVLLFWWQT